MEGITIRRKNVGMNNTEKLHYGFFPFYKSNKSYCVKPGIKRLDNALNETVCCVCISFE